MSKKTKNNDGIDNNSQPQNNSADQEVQKRDRNQENDFNRAILEDLNKRLEEAEKETDRLKLIIKELVIDNANLKSQYDKLATSRVKRERVKFLSEIIGLFEELDVLKKFLQEHNVEKKISQPILMVINIFEKFLSNQSITKYNPMIGAKVEEANNFTILEVSEKEIENGEEGTFITHVLKPGYILGEEIIRGALILAEKKFFKKSN